MLDTDDDRDARRQAAARRSRVLVGWAICLAYVAALGAACGVVAAGALVQTAAAALRRRFRGGRAGGAP